MSGNPIRYRTDSSLQFDPKLFLQGGLDDGLKEFLDHDICQNALFPTQLTGMEGYMQDQFLQQSFQQNFNSPSDLSVEDCPTSSPGSSGREDSNSPSYEGGRYDSFLSSVHIQQPQQSNSIMLPPSIGNEFQDIIFDDKPGIIPINEDALSRNKRRKRDENILLDSADHPFPFYQYQLPTIPSFHLFSNAQIDLTPNLDLNIRADKNVHYSEMDQAWIHYKQNHFQITSELLCTTGMPSLFFVQTQTNSLQSVEGLYVEVYAVKSNNRTQWDKEESRVELNQTGKSRTKEENHIPPPCLLQNGRAVHPRLRFQSSTAHNARTKNNEINPNQQYFRLVVVLQALSQGVAYPILRKISGPLIVRGQNPGRYASGQKIKSQALSTPALPDTLSSHNNNTMMMNTTTATTTTTTSSMHNNNNNNMNGGHPIPGTHMHSAAAAAMMNASLQQQQQQQQQFLEMAEKSMMIPSQPQPPSNNTLGSWNKISEDQAIIQGKVGINTSNPSEALSVHGNILVTGTVLKPSDQRIKENFIPVDTSEQLEHITSLKLYDYELKEWKEAGKTKRKERGVIAQELQKIMPYAVEELGNVQLNNGETVQNLLVVNERILLFENIGATQELKSLLDKEMDNVDDLDKRVQTLEIDEQGISKDLEEDRNKLERVIDYITHEEYRLEKDDGTSCCYCSIFGLGPAWTIWIMGFFFPVFWLVGIPYLASWSTARRKAGMANLITLTIYGLWWFFLSQMTRRHLSVRVATVLGVAEFVVGVSAMVMLTVYLNRKNRERNFKRDKLRQFILRPKLYNSSFELQKRKFYNV